VNQPTALRGYLNKYTNDMQRWFALKDGVLSCARITSASIIVEKRTPILLAPTAHGKLRAIIKLKALPVREKHRALRAQVVERLQHSMLLPQGLPPHTSTYRA
jgi:hypothetical protein